MKRNILRITTVAFIMAVVFLTSCQKEELVKVIGYVQGYVFNGLTNEVVDSVKVEWAVAGEKYSTTATASNGYTIKDLPEGSYSIWFSKDNYAKMVTNVYVGTEFGLSSDATVKGGENKLMMISFNPNLFPLSASFKGIVSRSINGVNIPTAGVTVQLSYFSNYNSDDRNYRFVPDTYTTTTDADGNFSFSNIPSTSCTAYFSYTDADGNIYSSSTGIDLGSFPNYNRNYTVGIQNSNDIRLISTNIWDTIGVATQTFSVSDNIVLTFNKPIDKTLTENQGSIYLNNANTGYTILTTVTYGENSITIDPDGDLANDEDYVITYKVYSNSDEFTNGSISFKTVSDITTAPGKVSGLSVDYDTYGTDWKADYDTKSIQFVFNRVEGAERYEFYAKDNYSNSEYMLIKTYTPADYQTEDILTSGATLPSSFDYYEDDWKQTPFSHGTIVSYKIRAINSFGEGEFSDAVTVKDETPFDSGDIYMDYVSGTGDNSGGTNDTVLIFSLNFTDDQYADIDHTPTVKLFDNTDTEVTITSTFTWESEMQGKISITVPKGEDYSGYVVRVSDVTDSSGNKMDADEYISTKIWW